MPTPVWRRYLTFWRADVARDVDDELRFHLEERTADLIAIGLTPAEARRQALDEFGDVAFMILAEADQGISQVAVAQGGDRQRIGSDSVIVEL